MSDPKKQSKDIVARLLSKKKALAQDAVISDAAQELLRHTANELFATRMWAATLVGFDHDATAAAPIGSKRSRDGLTSPVPADGDPDDDDGAVDVRRFAPTAENADQVLEVLRSQLMKVLKWRNAESESGAKWLGNELSDLALAIVVSAAALLLDDPDHSPAVVPVRVARETFSDLWGAVLTPGVTLPAWMNKVHALLKIAGIAVEPLPAQFQPPQPLPVDRTKKASDLPAASPLETPQAASPVAPDVAPAAAANFDFTAHLPTDPLPSYGAAPAPAPAPPAPASAPSPPPQEYIAPSVMARPVPSAVELEASGALGFSIAPEFFGFSPHVIDAMATHMGATDRRHLLFTLYRLRTGTSVSEAAQHFRIDSKDRRLGFPTAVLFDPSASAGLERAIPTPEPLVHENKATAEFGPAWNVARRLVATVPFNGGSWHIAAMVRIDGYVMATSIAPRDRELDSFRNLRDVVKAPPAIPNDATAIPHFVGPVVLRGEQQVLTPHVDQTQSQAQADIIARILQPAAEFRGFTEAFELLKVRGGIDRNITPGIVNVIALGYNLVRREALFGPLPSSPGAAGPQHHNNSSHHHGPPTGPSVLPKHLLQIANAASLKMQQQAASESGRCCFCGNRHPGSRDRRDRCQQYEHHPYYDRSRHFAVAYLVEKGHLQPHPVKRHR